MDSGLTIDLSNRHATHIVRFVKDLADIGWYPVLFPHNLKLLSNRQLVELRAPQRNIRVRVSIYKVSDRGEPHRLDERRIEITTTFGNGLSVLRNWADVVFGYSPVNDAYVGLNPRRLHLGGVTHNASSSVDPAALSAASKSHILIRPHQTPSLGLEYQAIFRPERLAEYLFNLDEIHEGSYRGGKLFSGNNLTKRHGSWRLPSSHCKGLSLVLSNANPTETKGISVTPAIVEAYERDEVSELADLSPDELEEVLRKCRMVGDAGEHFVYRHERKSSIKQDEAISPIRSIG